MAINKFSSKLNSPSKTYQQVGVIKLIVMLLLVLTFISLPIYLYINSFPAGQALNWYNYILLLGIILGAVIFSYGVLAVWHIIAAVNHDSKIREAISRAINKKYEKKSS